MVASVGHGPASRWERAAQLVEARATPAVPTARRGQLKFVPQVYEQPSTSSANGQQNLAPTSSKISAAEHPRPWPMPPPRPAAPEAESHVIAAQAAAARSPSPSMEDDQDGGGDASDELVKAEVLADMVPIEGTIEQNIDKMHEKLDGSPEAEAHVGNTSAPPDMLGEHDVDDSTFFV